MAKKIIYKVVRDVDIDALEDLLNDQASKGWILDTASQVLGQGFVLIFRDK